MGRRDRGCPDGHPRRAAEAERAPALLELHRDPTHHARGREEHQEAPQKEEAMFKFTQAVQVVGPQGTARIDVDLTFSFPPKEFSPGMTMIVTREIQNAVQRIVEEARKIK
jgi:hypothetical protein